MPKFLDHHNVVPPPYMVDETRKAIKSGAVGPHGVKGLNGFIAKGESWCLTEAPSVEAVQQHHEAMGIKLGPHDVVEVVSII